MNLIPRRYVKLSSNGRITIPADIRRSMHLVASDKHVIEQVDDAIRVRRATVTELTAGSLAKYRKVPPLTPAEERAAFEHGVAEQVAASIAAEADD